MTPACLYNYVTTKTMQYKTSKCPNCGVYIEIFQPTGSNDFEAKIGDPFSVCVSCLQPYNNGKKYWSEFSSADKVFMFIVAIFGAVMSGFMISLILHMVIYGGAKLFSIELAFEPKTIVYLAAVGCVCSIYVHFVEIYTLSKIKPNNIR